MSYPRIELNDGAGEGNEQYGSGRYNSEILGSEKKVRALQTVAEIYEKGIWRRALKNR